MRNSLTGLSRSAEDCELADWIKIYGYSDFSDRMVSVNELRDPLAATFFQGVDVACVIGFRTGAEPPVPAYFWCPDLGGINYQTLRNRPAIQELVGFAALLAAADGAERLDLDRLVESHGSQLAVLFRENRDFLDRKALHWGPPSDLVFAALYSATEETGITVFRGISNCIAFHEDYFRTKSAVWNCAPVSYLFDSSRCDSATVARLLLEPKCFDPGLNPPEGWFLWPWQRSLRKDEKGSNVCYSPVETTSLVFDLRKSTIALEQLRDEDVGLFSSFIKEVVRVAKKSVFDHGGFFDKETGDGIVAHFTDFSWPGAEIEPASVRAFAAAKALIGSVQAVCDAFQSRLRMGVGGLGASVGLHSGKAVWICENNLVSAYGESVIMAARLCGEAAIGSVFVSNHELQKLAASLPGEAVSRFERKAYSGKEYADRAQLFGYLVQVAEPQSTTTGGQREA